VQLQPLINLAKDEDPIATGNAGLFIKPDGSVRLFCAFGSMDAKDFTPQQLETSETLYALTCALRVPKIMEVLKVMANDPAISGAKAN
jgi:hypothetical protein